MSHPHPKPTEGHSEAEPHGTVEGDRNPESPPGHAADGAPSGARRIPFDAVLFDMDGTLIATDAFWVPAAQAGAERAFRELGLDRPIPGPEAWLGMVGLPLRVGFDQVFGDLDPDQRGRVLERVLEEEEAAMARHGLTFLPGVRDTLVELRARGVRMGIASNCEQSYLDRVVEGLGLGEFFEETRCLDSPGIRDKADMVEDLLTVFGTRRAVFVGDREGDRDAAWANGLPHVHLRGGFAPRGEQFECEAVLSTMHPLIDRLRARDAWIEEVLGGLGIRAEGPLGGLRTLAVSGTRLAGKSILARDLAGWLRDRGRPVHVESLGAWSRETPVEGDDPLLRGYDLDRLAEVLLEPHALGRGGRSAEGRTVGPDELLVLEGPWLIHPRVRRDLDRVLWVEASDEVRSRRVAGRDGRLHGPGPLREHHGAGQEEEERFRALYDPSVRADLVVDGSNALGRMP